MSVTNVYQVYVIRNATGKFYIGPSENVQIRLREHKYGIRFLPLIHLMP